MKTFSRILFCFLLLTVSRVTAQETFAPLISENCIAFVHVDFRNVELDAVKNSLQKFGEDFLKELGFDEKSFKATARELGVELEKLDILVRPTFDTITKELGIREVACIADLDLIAQGMPPFVVAIPWKNKTDKDADKFIKTLAAAVGDNNPPPFEETHFFKANGFLLLPFAPGGDSRVADWAKAIEPAPAKSPILEALKSVANAEVKFAVAVPEQARLMLRNAPLPPDVPAEVRNFLLFAAQKIQWASSSVSFADFLGGDTAAKTPAPLLTVKMVRPTDAKMIYGMLENLIELGVNTTRFGMDMQMRDEGFQIPPLAYQFARGFLRTLLPDVEEDKLIFRVKANVHGSQQALVAVAGTSIALLLPAVQAAREAARRMQCTNHIKQIVLAIHCYHDANNALPPLYTVDADGKPLHSWRVLLLPYMEQQALYQQIRLDEPYDSEHNKQFHAMVPSVYRCPSSNQSGGSSYSAIVGGGLLPNKKANSRGEHTLSIIIDGTSNTIAIVEVNDTFNWMAPMGNITLEELSQGINSGGRVGSHHHGGMNVGMFDGSVRFLHQSIDKETLRNAGRRDSGKPFMLP